MKKLVFLLFFIFLGAFLFFYFSQQKTIKQKSMQYMVHNTPTVTPSEIMSSALFVPYWTNFTHSSYAPVIYFGITVNEKGIDTKEDGYASLQNFLSSYPTQQKFLTIRMTDTNLNEKILQDSALSQTIFTQAVQLAEKNGFSGIVLDLEYSGFAFPTVTSTITSFSGKFAQVAHAHSLLFYQTVYGDTFYRSRPFDVGRIGKFADGLLIMSYDFHKANGNPGPNFPLETMPDEDYNFLQMVKDFSQKVEPSKLTVVFGMFGYDWTIDEKGRSIKQAESLATSAIEKKFLPTCSFKKCTITKNHAGETNIMYRDNENNDHSVWYESVGSVEKKEEVVKELGITHVGFWANGYW